MIVGGKGQKQAIVFKRPLVLATVSKARRALVSSLGISFTTRVVKIDESVRNGEILADYVGRLALAKANECDAAIKDAVVVAVDTAIGLDDCILGKPRDLSHAKEMLLKLSGRQHDVASAIAVRDLLNGKVQIETTHTLVTFSRLTETILEWYLNTGEWRGRAGAYAIQEKGAALVEDIRGCFTNVIGISIPTLIRMLPSWEQ